jgi:hypothetical protein
LEDLGNDRLTAVLAKMVLDGLMSYDDAEQVPINWNLTVIFCQKLAQGNQFVRRSYVKLAISRGGLQVTFSWACFLLNDAFPTPGRL